MKPFEQGRNHIMEMYKQGKSLSEIASTVYKEYDVDRNITVNDLEKVVHEVILTSM